MAKRSIAGIAVRKDRILVAKRVEGGPIGLRWEFPGGKVEEDETDEEALKREFDEELGITIVPLRLLGTSSFFSASGERELAAWLVDIPHESILELREHSDIAWLRLDELSAIDLADSDRSLLPFIILP
ncbi:MAG TPA: NUDIX domain-containing protein [Rectinemataceae bacterium]|nr:NUDIX domain-containing protein [Rectinemataceae bacterium]